MLVGLLVLLLYHGGVDCHRRALSGHQEREGVGGDSRCGT